MKNLESIGTSELVDAASRLKRITGRSYTVQHRATASGGAEVSLYAAWIAGERRFACDESTAETIDDLIVQACSKADGRVGIVASAMLESDATDAIQFERELSQRIREIEKAESINCEVAAVCSCDGESVSFYDDRGDYVSMPVTGEMRERMS